MHNQKEADFSKSDFDLTNEMVLNSKLYNNLDERKNTWQKQNIVDMAHR